MKTKENYNSFHLFPKDLKTILILFEASKLVEILMVLGNVLQ